MEEEQIMNQIPVLNLPFRLFWPLGLVSYEGLKTKVFTNILSFQIRVLCTSNYEINLHLSACRFNTAGCALSLSLSLSTSRKVTSLHCYTYYINFRKMPLWDMLILLKSIFLNIYFLAIIGFKTHRMLSMECFWDLKQLCFNLWEIKRLKAGKCSNAREG